MSWERERERGREGERQREGVNGVCPTHTRETESADRCFEVLELGQEIGLQRVPAGLALRGPSVVGMYEAQRPNKLARRAWKRVHNESRWENVRQTGRRVSGWCKLGRCVLSWCTWLCAETSE